MTFCSVDVEGKKRGSSGSQEKSKSLLQVERYFVIEMKRNQTQLTDNLKTDAYF